MCHKALYVTALESGTRMSSSLPSPDPNQAVVSLSWLRATGMKKARGHDQAGIWRGQGKGEWGCIRVGEGGLVSGSSPGGG